MQYTFVFDSQEGKDNSYLLAFVPSPVWMKGKQEIHNLHPDYPHYRDGDLRLLLERERLSPRKVVLVVHPSGHAGAEDLQAILGELDQLKIAVQQIDL